MHRLKILYAPARRSGGGEAAAACAARRQQHALAAGGGPAWRLSKKRTRHVDRVAVEASLPSAGQPHADDLVGEVHQVEVEAVLREALLVPRETSPVVSSPRAVAPSRREKQRVPAPVELLYTCRTGSRISRDARRRARAV